MGVEARFMGASPDERARVEKALAKRASHGRPRDGAIGVFVLGPEPAKQEDAAAWREAYVEAREQDRPVVGVLVGGAQPPPAEALPDETGGLASAPWLDARDDLSELEAVLDALAPPLAPVPAPERRPARPEPGPVGGRDPVLMRIATTSGGVGLLLLGTLGFGPASLFLFLSAISFAISRLPEPDEEG